MRDQVWKRILAICSAAHWPGITHETVWSMPLGVWLLLAVSCDQAVAKEIEQARRIERQMRG